MVSVARPALRLVTLKISPWSERAKWALDHHQIAYQVIEHVPFLGERRLRRLVGPTHGRATVPVLSTGDQVLTESWDIAHYADREGKGSRLIPAEHEDEIRAWNTLADETMTAGRARVAASILNDTDVLEEGMPPEIPALLRPLLRPVMRYGTRWFARKYELDFDSLAAQKAKLHATLTALRRALPKDKPYLLGAFSYADIVMAMCLQNVVPVAGPFIPLGKATRKAWTQDDVATEFADLIAWRDRLYELHRGQKATAA